MRNLILQILELGSFAKGQVSLLVIVKEAKTLVEVGV